MCGLSVGILSGAVLLCSCSTNLGPETLPSTTPVTETSEETEITEPTETEIPEHTEPNSQAIITGSIVEAYGKLSIEGSSIKNSEGGDVVLKGISSYGIQECGDFFDKEVIKTLAEDWGCDVLRIAVTGDAAGEGYIKDPDKYFDTVCKICDMCEAQGIYVIVDWNVCYGEEAGEHTEAAVDFFSRLSAIYSESFNIIYEINNDPVKRDMEMSSETEWDECIWPFATAVIEAVRANDDNNIIIVGAPNYGLDVNESAVDPFEYSNIAYGCRIYSGPHNEAQRDKVSSALDEDVCVFVTQWGLSNEYGVGGIHPNETSKWIEYLDENSISWCNYAIGSNTSDDTNALNMDDERYTDEQKSNAHWPYGLLSESGNFAREQFLKIEETSEPEESAEETEEE